MPQEERPPAGASISRPVLKRRPCVIINTFDEKEEDDT
jgi:hypothetical protein